MESKEREHILTFKTKSNQTFSVFKISEEHTWNVCNFVVANENRLLDFFPLTREQNLTPDLSKRFVKIKQKQFEAKEEFLFTLRAEKSSSIIGLIYIKELDWVKKQGEFAYAIDYNFEGKGITSLVVSKLSDYAFQELNLQTLQIIAHKSNFASIRVAEKNDFKWIRTLEKSFTPKGKDPFDMELYERYKS